MSACVICSDFELFYEQHPDAFHGLDVRDYDVDVGRAEDCIEPVDQISTKKQEGRL